ncbi:hypothetical protein F2Q69_00029568 [Brassica cretica]|uniref:Uncharacterized protein n=1 Tax=Brassica cretica TaxID=69181 RepID=A0A8S9S8F6_BRACR|nr:hypothetical protein F2Q69_00029568 [Brassica cretica]
MYADTLFLGATNTATRYCSMVYCICREKAAGMSSRKKRFDSADAGVGDMSLIMLPTNGFSNMTSYEL